MGPGKRVSVCTGQGDFENDCIVKVRKSGVKEPRYYSISAWILKLAQLVTLKATY